ncbi:hypothetical protein V8C86DRAFT_2796584 [Haematococcus lacustris]
MKLTRSTLSLASLAREGGTDDASPVQQPASLQQPSLSKWIAGLLLQLLPGSASLAKQLEARQRCLVQLQPSTRSWLYINVIGQPLIPGQAASGEQEPGALRYLQTALHTALTEPGSSPPAAALNLFLFAVILLSTLGFVLDTLPGGEGGRVYALVEAVTVQVYAADYLLRLLTCPSSRLRWLVLPMNFIDLLSFLPWYIGRALQASNANVTSVFRVLRLLRVAQVLRLGGREDKLSLVALTLVGSLDLLGLLAFLMLMASLFFSTFMFLAERGSFDPSLGYWVREGEPAGSTDSSGAFTPSPSPYSSVPQGMWWAVVTLCTVGYGDVFPLTALGKLIASLAMLLGVVLLALPISVLSSNIVTRWLDMKKQHARGSSPPPPHLLLYEGVLGRHSASVEALLALHSQIGQEVHSLRSRLLHCHSAAAQARQAAGPQCHNPHQAPAPPAAPRQQQLLATPPGDTPPPPPLPASPGPPATQPAAPGTPSTPTTLASFGPARQPAPHSPCPSASLAPVLQPNNYSVQGLEAGNGSLPMALRRMLCNSRCSGGGSSSPARPGSPLPLTPAPPKAITLTPARLPQGHTSSSCPRGTPAASALAGKGSPPSATPAAEGTARSVPVLPSPASPDLPPEPPSPLLQDLPDANLGAQPQLTPPAEEQRSPAQQHGSCAELNPAARPASGIEPGVRLYLMSDGSAAGMAGRQVQGGSGLGPGNVDALGDLQQASSTPTSHVDRDVGSPPPASFDKSPQGVTAWLTWIRHRIGGRAACEPTVADFVRDFSTLHRIQASDGHASEGQAASRARRRAGEASALEQQLADSLHAMEQLQQVTNLLLQGGLQDCIVRGRRWHGRLAEQQQEAQDLKAGLAAAQGEVRALQAALAALAALAAQQAL